MYMYPRPVSTPQADEKTEKISCPQRRREKTEKISCPQRRRLLAKLLLQDWYRQRFPGGNNDGKPFITAIGNKTRRANHSGRIGVDGWPMFNGQGQIVGVHTGYGFANEPHFSTAQVALEHWERLVKGDACGRWMTGSGPMIGVITTGTENGGDEVTIEWRRADKTITKKIPLTPRRRK